MQKLLHGLHNFQDHVFGDKQDLFERLAEGQEPEALFITCSDSRVDPNLLMQADPGELFVLRNAGNIVPPYGVMREAEAATIEYAVNALKVGDIIVCGHSQCGAMKGLLHPESLSGLPAVKEFLRHAEETAVAVQKKGAELSAEDQHKLAIQQNVLVQLDHLQTHPSVKAALDAGTVKLHGWVYEFETGKVFAFQPTEGEFLAVNHFSEDGLGAQEAPAT